VLTLLNIAGEPDLAPPEPDTTVIQVEE